MYTLFCKASYSNLSSSASPQFDPLLPSLGVSGRQDFNREVAPVEGWFLLQYVLDKERVQNMARSQMAASNTSHRLLRCPVVLRNWSFGVELKFLNCVTIWVVEFFSSQFELLKGNKVPLSLAQTQFWNKQLNYVSRDRSWLLLLKWWQISNTQIVT